MIKYLMNEELFNGIKYPFLILASVVILIIILTYIFVRKEVKK